MADRDRLTPGFEDWLESWGWTPTSSNLPEDVNRLESKYRSSMWDKHYGPFGTSFKANFKAPDFDMFAGVWDALQFGFALGTWLYYDGPPPSEFGKWAGAVVAAEYSGGSGFNTQTEEELKTDIESAEDMSLKGYLAAVEACANEGQMVIITEKIGFEPFFEVAFEFQSNPTAFGEYPADGMFNALNMQVSPRYGDAVDGPLKVAADTMAIYGGATPTASRLLGKLRVSTGTWYSRNYSYDYVWYGWGAKKKIKKVPKVSGTYMPMTFENMDVYRKASIYADAGFRVVPKYMKGPGDLWTWSPGMTVMDRMRLATPGRGLPKVPAYSSPDYDKALENYLRRNALR